MTFSLATVHKLCPKSHTRIPSARLSLPLTSHGNLCEMSSTNYATYDLRPTSRKNLHERSKTRRSISSNRSSIPQCSIFSPVAIFPILPLLRQIWTLIMRSTASSFDKRHLARFQYKARVSRLQASGAILSSAYSCLLQVIATVWKHSAAMSSKLLFVPFISDE